MSWQEIVETFGGSLAARKKQAQRMGITREEMVKYLMSEPSWKEIGDMVGMNKDAVRMKIKRMGLSKAEFVEYHAKSHAESHPKQTPNRKSDNYKDVARSVARRSDTEVLHRHHWSYREEHYSDTILMSVSDHHALHSYLVYDDQEKMYRDKNGTLLRTKASHILLLSYITSLR